MMLKLYRCMSQAEFADLVSSGQFRGIPESYEDGKWFAESAEDASKRGEWFDTVEAVPTKHIIVEIELPFEVADGQLRHAHLDEIGPARFVPLVYLRGVPFREVKP